MVPGWKEPTTSRDAAKSVAKRSATLREFVLRALQTRPMTADEVAAFLGETVLSIRPRVAELRKLGRIVATGDKRRNESGMLASVWGAV